MIARRLELRHRRLAPLAVLTGLLGCGPQIPANAPRHDCGCDWRSALTMFDGFVPVPAEHHCPHPNGIGSDASLGCAVEALESRAPFRARLVGNYRDGVGTTSLWKGVPRDNAYEIHWLQFTLAHGVFAWTLRRCESAEPCDDSEPDCEPGFSLNHAGQGLTCVGERVLAACDGAE